MLCGRRLGINGQAHHTLFHAPYPTSCANQNTRLVANSIAVNGRTNGSNGSQPSPARRAPVDTPGDMAYWELLSNPEIDAISRAKSASDAAVLRRKGHLKEQDRLIDFMRDMHDTHTCEEVMFKMERWIMVRALVADSLRCMCMAQPPVCSSASALPF